MFAINYNENMERHTTMRIWNNTVNNKLSRLSVTWTSINETLMKWNWPISQLASPSSVTAAAAAVTGLC